MSTGVHSDERLPGGVEQVLAVLAGPGWAGLKAEALRDGSRVVERVEQPGGGVHLVISRELPPGGPSFLEKFLPKDGRVVQTDDWLAAEDGVRYGTWKVELPGTPARLGGSMRLEPAAGGCRYVVDGEVKVPIPLLGGRAEKFVAEMVTLLAAKEAGILRAAVAPA